MMSDLSRLVIQCTICTAEGFKVFKIFYKMFYFCSVYETEDITERKTTTVKLYDGNGHVFLTTCGKDTTFCPMNLKYFPFDKHSCEIQFTHSLRSGVYDVNSNYYEREGIVFQNGRYNANHQHLAEWFNEEWDLVSLKLDTKPRILKLGDSIITYPIYTVTLELQRKSSFYVMILMVPSVLICLISVIGFLLPSESGLLCCHTQ